MADFNFFFLLIIFAAFILFRQFFIFNGGFTRKNKEIQVIKDISSKLKQVCPKCKKDITIELREKNIEWVKNGGTMKVYYYNCECGHRSKWELGFLSVLLSNNIERS